MSRIGFAGNPSSLRPGSTNNTGNIVHGHAARSLFRDKIPVRIETTDENIEAIRNQVTHVGYVAATMLHTRTAPGYATGQERTAVFLEKLDLPVCAFGLGCQAPLDETVADSTVDPRSLRLLRAIAERSHTVGVRGEFTADLCAKYGVRNVTVMGCQSAHVAGLLNIGRPDLRTTGDRPLGYLSILPDERHVQRILMQSGADTIGQDNGTEEQIAAGLIAREAFVADTGNYYVFPTIRRMFDQGLMTRADYFDYIAGHFFKFYNVPDWRAHIRARNDFCFGTRFHGNMIALQAGIPALWLIHDMRTRELCDHLGLPAIMHAKVGPDTTLAELRERCDYSPFWAGLPRLTAGFLDYLHGNGVASRLKTEVSAGLAAIAAGQTPGAADHTKGSG